MGRAVAELAKIVRRTDETRAEVVLPDAITRAVSGFVGEAIQFASSRRPLALDPTGFWFSPAMIRGKMRGAIVPSVR